MDSKLLEQITEAYVNKGRTPLAISALVGLSPEAVEAAIKENLLEGRRALFLEENPQISARLANMIQLGKILKKQQEGTDVSSAELAFLTKLADQQREDQNKDDKSIYSMSKETIDKEIKQLIKQIFGHHISRMPGGKRTPRVANKT